MMTCNKRGKNMVSEKGAGSLGLLIQNHETDSKFMDAQFGKYADQREFRFCYECVIDAMMGAVK